MPSTEIQLSKQYPSIRIIKSSVASWDFQQMASATIYGTPGKMRYAHSKSLEKIKTLKNTSFLEFKKNSKTLGIVALVGHEMNIGKLSVSGLYVRYFSMNTFLRSNGPRTNKQLEKRGILHSVIKKLFDDHNSLSPFDIKNQSIAYAFVESTNERSLNMVKSMGFQSSRQLVTILFSRFYPKQKIAVNLLSKTKITEVNTLLKSFYKDYNLVPDFDENWENYFIHEVQGEVICGVKLESNTWHIHEMPGFEGWLFREILPQIPILNRIFQKGKIDFIGIERLYVRDGYEHLLPSFLETLCAQFGVTKAMIGVDNNSPIHHLLKTIGKLGLLDKIITPSPGLLFTRTYNVPNAEKQTIQSKPFYVSTYDMS